MRDTVGPDVNCEGKMWTPPADPLELPVKNGIPVIRRSLGLLRQYFFLRVDFTHSAIQGICLLGPSEERCAGFLVSDLSFSFYRAWNTGEYHWKLYASWWCSALINGCLARSEREKMYIWWVSIKVKDILYSLCFLSNISWIIGEIHCYFTVLSILEDFVPMFDPV